MVLVLNTFLLNKWRENILDIFQHIEHKQESYAWMVRNWVSKLGYLSTWKIVKHLMMFCVWLSSVDCHCGLCLRLPTRYAYNLSCMYKFLLSCIRYLSMEPLLGNIAWMQSEIDSYQIIFGLIDWLWNITIMACLIYVCSDKWIVLGLKNEFR